MYNPMTPLHHIEGISERFDEKFSVTEGCQAGDKVCGEIDKTTGQYVCFTCERWGGPEGEIKDWKKPQGSSAQIKSHILTEYLTFIDGMIEEVENMLDNKDFSDPKWPINTQDEVYGWNQAVYSFLSSLKSYREIISKQMK